MEQGIMGQILVRKLDDALIDAVRKRAKENNRSTEAEVRAILEAAVKQPAGADRPRRGLLDFVGSVPTGRTQQEIDDYVRALRDEWER